MNEYDDDVEINLDEDFDADAGVDEVEASDEEVKPEPKKKDDLPEGIVTPTGLTHLVNADEGCLQILKDLGKDAMTPQQMYGYVKTGKEFPSTVHTDGRVIVPVADGLAWVTKRLEDQLSRRQAKAVKDAAAAEKAAAAEADSSPEVAGDEPVEVD